MKKVLVAVLSETWMKDYDKEPIGRLQEIHEL